MGYHSSLCEMFRYEIGGGDHRRLSNRVRTRALGLKPEGIKKIVCPPSVKHIGEKQWTKLPWAVHHFYANDDEQRKMEQRFGGRHSSASSKGSDLTATQFYFELLEDAMLLFLTPISEIEI